MRKMHLKPLMRYSHSNTKRTLKWGIAENKLINKTAKNAQQLEMVSQEDLEALDLLIWLSNGNEVANKIHCNQSTISRRYTYVCKKFKIKFERSRGKISIKPSPLDHLLKLERQVHQGLRLHESCRLRIDLSELDNETEEWNAKLTAKGWIIGKYKEPNIDRLETLLNERIIDAAIIKTKNARTLKNTSNKENISFGTTRNCEYMLMALEDYVIERINGQTLFENNVTKKVQTHSCSQLWGEQGPRWLNKTEQKHSYGGARTVVETKF